MARTVVSGIEIDYELLGPTHAPAVVITPGGRYPRVTPGVPQLGLPGWAAQLTSNPRNREILLAQDPEEFISGMQQWAAAYAYSDVSPVPGTKPEELAQLNMPILVFRSGKSDISHTRRTSEWVHELLPNSRIIDPPWPDQEWNNCQAIPAEPGRGRFERWHDARTDAARIPERLRRYDAGG